MQQSIFGFLFLFLPFLCFTQENAPDCRSAFPLGNKTENTTGKVEGFGGVLELQPCGLLHCIKEEHNSYWYSFTPGTISTLTFELSPNQENGTINYMLYKADLDDYCSVIAEGRAIPMRTNISTQPGSKFANMNSDELFVPENGTNENKALEVIGGQLYYLVIDHPSGENEGHTIKLSYDTKAAIADKENSEPEEQNNYDTPITIHVTDKETGQPIEANFEITGIQKDPIVQEGKSRYVFGLEEYRSYTIKVNKKGYVFYASSIVTSGDVKPRTMNVELAPFNEGDKITVDNVYFKGDDAELLPTSGPALQALAKFMLENPDLEIEIGGHVNSKKNSPKAQKLSKQRAESVFYSLVLKDVPKNRMTYKGYGNTEMKYEDPQNEGESAANRRVEITIVKK